MVAVVRRTLLVAGVFGALYAALGAPPPLLRVAVTDFGAPVARGARSLLGPGGPESVEQRIASKTEGRLAPVTGPAWDRFFAEAHAALGSGASGHPWSWRRADTGRRGALYFATGEAPLSEIAARLGPDNELVYARLGLGPAARYLTVQMVFPGDYPDAPARLAAPYAWAAWALLAAGLLAYIGLPWPRQRAGSCHYHRVRSCVLPDLVGLLLGGTFFVLPVLIVPSASPHDTMFSGGWLWLTAILWVPGLLGLTTLAIAAWYEPFEISAGPDSLSIRLLRGSTEVPYAGIERVAAAAWRPPSWLVVLAFLSARGHSGGRGSALLLETCGSDGFRIVTRDGRAYTAWLRCLIGHEGLLQTIRDRGVPVDEGLAGLIRPAERAAVP